MAHRIRIAGVFAGLAAVSLAAAQNWEAEARRLRPADTSAAEQAVYRNLAARARATLDALPRAQDRAQADAARPRLQRELTRSLGYKKLPWPPDLRARVTGTVRKDGYRIEKVVYQGLPGEWIPADLYLPDPLRGRAPGILFYNGHWFPDSKARPDFQAFCINMAKFGFVVLNFETYGQGERGMSRRDHRRVEGLLVGVAQQGYAVYDSQVGLEYLLRRPEVDPARIGMTGASGGGFDTWMNAALDDRIKVAVPVVGTCDLYEQAVKRLPIDWDPNDHCHYIPGIFRYGNNHELLAMAAPKPVMVISATHDNSFPIAGVHDVVEYGRRLYRSYGMPERFAFSEDSTDAHGFQVRKREAAYGFFLRWLMQKGDGSAVPEPPTATLPFDSLDLRAFPPGQNQAAGPAMVAAVEHLAAGLPPASNRPRMEAALGPWPSAPAWTARLEPGRLQRVMVPSEPDLEVPAFLLRPEGKVQGLLVAVDDRGKEATLGDAAVRESLAAGWAVLGVDPRAMGESKTSKNTWLFAVGLFQGENLVWRQAWDILRTAQAVASNPEFRAVPLALYAGGQNASLAAAYLLGHAAETGTPRLRWFLLRDAFLTYHDFVSRPKSEPLSFALRSSDDDARQRLDREIPGNYIPFDCLDYFDIPQLLAAPGIPGMLIQPIDGDWLPMAAESARKLLSGRLQVAAGAAAEETARRFVRETAGGRHL